MARLIQIARAVVMTAMPCVLTAQDVVVRARSEPPASTLAEIIARALPRHPLILAAEERGRAQRGMRITAGAWTNPVLEYQVENAPYPGRPAPAGLDRELMTSLMVPLDPFYLRPSRVRVASARVRVADAELAATRRQVALDVAHEFYALASANVAVRAGTDVRDWLDSLVQYTRARVTEGAAAEADLIRLLVERDRADAELALAEIDAARASASLAAHLTTAEAVTSLHVSVPDSLMSARDLPSLDQLLAIARDRRAEIHATRERVAGARAGRSLENRRLIPQLEAMVGSKSMAGTGSFMAGLSVPLPILDQNRGERQRADAELREAEWQREWAERAVTAEVTAAYRAATSLTRRLELMQSTFLQRAEESRRIALAAYREGATSLLQVIDAARTLAEARQAFYRLLYAQHESVLELHAAAGATDILSMPSPLAPTTTGARQ